MKKHIYILATGGTIAGKAASEAATTGYEAGAIGIADLLAAVPELRHVADVKGEQIAAIDSKDMTSAIWLRLRAAMNCSRARMSTTSSSRTARTRWRRRRISCI